LNVIAADWLRKRRLELDLNQGELAARLESAGFSTVRASISNWENGRHEPPLDDPNFRQAMAKALKLSVTEMLEMAGYEVAMTTQSDEARRAAAIIERLPESARELALDYLKTLEKRFVG
jgi:transcriptional regulator with XRE-family HTH domain